MEVIEDSIQKASDVQKRPCFRLSIKKQQVVKEEIKNALKGKKK